MKNVRAFLVAAACLLPTLGLAATVTLTPTADAFVHGGKKANKNYGGNTQLRAQINNTAASNYDSYLKFDTRAATGEITRAKLRLYASLSRAGSVSNSTHAVGNTGWSETTITWNNRPALGAALGSFAVTSKGYAWKEIDVTAYVQSEKAAGRNVISLGLHNAATSSVYVRANSREARSNKPELVIVTAPAVNVPPSVSLTAPASGSSYTAPVSITLTASGIDSDGTIASLTFYNGAALIGTGTLAGGSYTFAWSNVAAGSYSLTAVATDDQGASTISAPVSISVNPPANVPPSVSLTSPTDGSSYTAPASITLTADATDSDGSIASVEFYDGATLIASLTAPPYSYTWNDVQSGSHSLTAKATDNQGTATTSAPVTVNVNATTASGVYYIHADHLNTPRVITDASNKVVWRWDSDPFGAEKANEDPDGDGAKFTYNLRFPGQYYDRETNLHYNYFRDYDPTTGRYVEADPIGIAGGVNVYEYARSNPLRYTDPLGLAPYNDPMNQIANRAAGLPPNANLPPSLPPVPGGVGAIGDFLSNYRDMRDANTIGADKYFHCKANCEAAKRGKDGQKMACEISDAREWFDQNIKRDPASASAADQVANQYGRSQGASSSQSCPQICAPFRPTSLPTNY